MCTKRGSEGGDRGRSTLGKLLATVWPACSRLAKADPALDDATTRTAIEVGLPWFETFGKRQLSARWTAVSPRSEERFWLRVCPKMGDRPKKGIDESFRE